MDLLDRIIIEIKEESGVVIDHMQRTWGSMSTSQQAFGLGILCAAFLLIAILQPAPKTASALGYDHIKNYGTLKVFIMAVVVLLIMTFGLDIAIEGLR